MPLQLTLNTSATILLDSYYIPASSSSSTFRKAVDDPTWFKGYTSNSDLGADYSTGTDYFKLNAVRGTANASQLVLPALLRRDTSEIRAQWDNSGGILGAGPGPALFSAKEPQSSVFQELIGSLTSPTGTPLEPYSAFGLYFTSADGGWMDVGAFDECVLGSKMQFFDQSRPCQWSMRLDNLYVLTYGERSYAAVPVVAGVDSVAIGFDLSLDRFAGPYKVMQPLIALLTFGANKYAETVFRMHNVMLSASTGIDLDYSLFVNQTITGPGSLTCSFKFKVDNDTSVQNTFTLGKPFFRKYYVGFHYPTSKVGIGKFMT
ncbi:hypothetical protein BGZ52_008570 [Haplosporangium bisporale]|nr:hypothetical protein BGZ52_008570 [Haplosporangium bisporale]